MTGTELRAIRERLGMSQAELARAVGRKHYMTVWRWERREDAIPDHARIIVERLFPNAARGTLAKHVC